MVFGKTRFVIHRHHLNFLRGKRPDGTLPSLNEIELQVVKEEIQRLHSKYPPEYPTYEDIKTFIYEKYGKMLLRDTLRNLIYNKLHVFFRPCNAKPVESDRMNVTIQQIEDNLMELRRAIQGVPPHFCVNIDEMGQTKFGDTVQKIVIVPSNYDKNEASYPNERAGKRASCILYFSYRIVLPSTIYN